MEIAISVNGVPIRLTDERWSHIVNAHDDLAGYSKSCEHHVWVFNNFQTVIVERSAGSRGRVGAARWAVPSEEALARLR